MEQQKEERYNVVFEYTREAGAYEGIVTWTSFSNENEFTEWRKENLLPKNQRVVDHGVTEEEAIELAKRTSIACHLAVAEFEAKGDPYRLKMELMKIAMSLD